MTQKVRKYLEAIKAAVESVAPGAEIILFGSQARGDAGPDSDIDLLVLVDKDKLSWNERLAIATPIYDVELNLQIPINPVIRTRSEWFEKPFKTPFYVNVMNEGITV